MTWTGCIIGVFVRGCRKLFGDTHQQASHAIVHFGRSVQAVGKPEESHYQTLPRWRGQNGCQDVFLFAVSFANLPFHPVSFYSPFETSFRHGHQYGYKRSRGFYGNRHEDYAERKGRHGFAASGEQSVYDAFATQALRFMK